MDSMRPILARPPGSETDLLRLRRWTTIRITAFRLGSMLGLCLAVTSFSSPLRAADFRTLDFGAACDSVVTREQARGSVPIPGEKISGADVYGFRGREYDRDLVLTYFCPKGVLFSGNYYFPVEGLETAIVSYRIALRTLGEMSLRELEDGSGTITFGPAPPFNWMMAPGWPGATKKVAPAFEFVEGARNVYEQIRKAQSR